jgi:hypothetical protein
METTTDKHRKSNRVLLDERPLVLLPSLAKAVGMNAALVIQQLHYHLVNPDNGREHDGEQWIYKRYEDWQRDDFPLWSTRTIQRIFLALEQKTLVVARQFEGRKSRIKYYRINYDRLASVSRMSSSRASRARSKTTSCRLPSVQR